jgi:hypothetical protein
LHSSVQKPLTPFDQSPSTSSLYLCLFKKKADRLFFPCCRRERFRPTRKKKQRQQHKAKSYDNIPRRLAYLGSFIDEPNNQISTSSKF